MWARGLALGFAVCVMGSSAWAQDAPFQPDTHWVPFNHYKDTGAVSEEPDVASFPTVAPEPEAAPPPPPAAPAAVAMPKRPIDLPILPGMNKGFAVKVNSTDDDYVPPAAAAGNTQVAPDIHLPDKRWVDPNVASPARKAGESDEDAPLNVRQSFLPNQKITPTPSADHPSALALGRAQLKKAPTKKKDATKQQTPEDAAACAAIDAYKKQQLDAIQGDRQTLQALQEAIKSLGLQKQLGFIAGQDSALRTTVPQEPATIDIPTSTPAP